MTRSSHQVVVGASLAGMLLLGVGCQNRYAEDSLPPDPVVVPDDREEEIEPPLPLDERDEEIDEEDAYEANPGEPEEPEEAPPMPDTQPLGEEMPMGEEEPGEDVDAP